MHGAASHTAAVGNEHEPSRILRPVRRKHTAGDGIVLEHPVCEAKGTVALKCDRRAAQRLQSTRAPSKREQVHGQQPPIDCDDFECVVGDAEDRGLRQIRPARSQHEEEDVRSDHSV